jgi:hypothetical protein
VTGRGLCSLLLFALALATNRGDWLAAQSTVAAHVHRVFIVIALNTEVLILVVVQPVKIRRYFAVRASVGVRHFMFDCLLFLYGFFRFALVVRVDRLRMKKF